MLFRAPVEIWIFKAIVIQDVLLGLTGKHTAFFTGIPHNKTTASPGNFHTNGPCSLTQLYLTFCPVSDRMIVSPSGFK